MRDVLRETWHRCLAVVQGRRRDADFDDELQTHLELATEELAATGLDREEARRRAVHAIGGLEPARLTHRDARGLPWLEQGLADVRYGARRLMAAPAFTIAVTGILAVGIGANTAIFSVVNAIVLRPLPFADADRLVWIAPDARSEGLSARTYPIKIVEEMQRGSSSLSGLSGYFAFFGYASYTLTGRGDAERMVGVPVGPQLFELLGVHPAKGRTFTAEELAPNGPRAMLLTHAAWQHTFAGDPSIVGQTVILSDVPVTVTGVLPESFDFASIFLPGTKVDMFVPADYAVMSRQGNVLSVIGRLAPGVSIDAARAEFASLMPRINAEFTNWGVQTATLKRLDEHVNEAVERSLLVLWVAVGLVLLIVCANLSGLLLARTASRSKEIAVRLAIGASRGRIVRQLITESALLSLLGAALGVPLAFALVSYVRTRPGLSLPLLHRVEVDGMALLFTAGIAVACGIAFGLLPAARIANGDPQHAMREQSRGSTQGLTQARLRSALVAGEVALACILLVSAGLLLRTFLRVQAVDLGFAPSQTLAMRVNTSSGLDDAARRVVLQEIARRVAALPGIESAGLTDALPLERNRTWTIGVPGREYPAGQRPLAFAYMAGPGFFRTMGMRLKDGRDLAESDRADNEPVVVVSESLARVLYPGQSAVGRLAQIGRTDLRIVGVVADIRQTSLETGGALHFYLPFTQSENTSMDLVVRSSLPVATIAPEIRRMLGALDPRLSATDLRPMETLVDRAISPRRFLVALLGSFAAIALALACVGIYSTVAFSVGERVREFGVRMALGATAGQISRGVFRQTAILAGIGLAIGALASLWVTRLMSSLLYETSATDAMTFAATALILAAVAVLAGYVPAARAARLSPMVALRDE
jgi:predicted permease